MKGFFWKFLTCLPILLLLAVPSAHSKREGLLLPNMWCDFPKLSPDGLFYAVQSPPREEGEGSPKTYVVRADSFEVVSRVNSNFFPKWSPDSRFLACTKILEGHEGDCLEIYEAASGVRRNLVDVPGWSEFFWSPDSDRLLLAAKRRIFIVPAFSSGAPKVECRTIPGEYYWSSPVWSPDGKSVAACAYITQESPRRTRIVIWNTMTGDRVHSLDTIQKVGYLSWSPSGDHFIYSEPGKLNFLSSDSMKEIHQEAVDDIDPVRFIFSPDGGRMAFQDCQYIHVFSLHDRQKLLTIEGARNGFFSFKWSPDGKYFLINDLHTVAVCDAESGRYIGYRKFPDMSHVEWGRSNRSVILSINHRTSGIIPVNLPAIDSDITVFDEGSRGSPGWEHNEAPRTLEECFEAFDRCLLTEAKKKFNDTDEDELFNYGGGSNITDSLVADVYCKWGVNDLRKWFLKRGISDPRDVTGIMLVSYWRHLHSKPIDLDEQIRFHLAWWEQQRRSFQRFAH